MHIKKYVAKMAVMMALLCSTGCNDPEAVAYLSNTAGGLAGGAVAGTLGAGLGSTLLRVGGLSTGSALANTLYNKHAFTQQGDYAQALQQALNGPDSLSTDTVALQNQQSVRLTVQPRQMNGLGQICRGYKAQTVLVPADRAPTVWNQKPAPETDAGMACQDATGTWVMTGG